MGWWATLAPSVCVCVLLFNLLSVGVLVQRVEKVWEKE